MLLLYHKFVKQKIALKLGEITYLMSLLSLGDDFIGYGVEANYFGSRNQIGIF